MHREVMVLQLCILAQRSGTVRVAHLSGDEELHMSSGAYMPACVEANLP